MSAGPMRAAFLGTPTAAIPSLIGLMEVADVNVVITRPDAPRGRSRRPSPPPMKLAAREFGIDVAQPATKVELLRTLQDRELDVGVVVAYGRILDAATLATTRVGFVNVHFSLLPLWRGAAPVERAILAGDEATGVSLMLIDEGLDTGPVIAVAETEIAADDTGGSLTAALASLGGELLADHLVPFSHGQRDPAPQLDRLATHSSRLGKAEAQVVSGTPALVAERMIRAFHPRPGAWVALEGSPAKLLAGRLTSAAVPDGVIDTTDGRALLGLAEGVVEITRIQPAGRKPMSGAAFANGRRGEMIAIDS